MMCLSSSDSHHQLATQACRSASSFGAVASRRAQPSLRHGRASHTREVLAIGCRLPCWIATSDHLTSSACSPSRSRPQQMGVLVPFPSLISLYVQRRSLCRRRASTSLQSPGSFLSSLVHQEQPGFPRSDPQRPTASLAYWTALGHFPRASRQCPRAWNATPRKDEEAYSTSLSRLQTATLPPWRRCWCRGFRVQHQRFVQSRPTGSTATPRSVCMAWDSSQA
mmetsp:Transcript_145754/g.379110  ORF Transcript_145754/g.379110 Transcript_145754/m.379110 type:complete len:223 (-) Transcript_145754:98-766(-)